MKSGSDNELLKRIIESLQLVAASADEQIEALPPTVCIPDEIALTLYETCAVLPRLREAGLVSPELEEMLALIDQAFEELSGQSNRDFWTEDAMRGDPRWMRMRDMASAVLGYLQIARRTPNIYWQESI